MSIKERIIAKFGSVNAVAEACGVTQGAVSQWIRIPSRHQDKLLIAARVLGIDLSTDDFFDSPTNTNKT